MKKALVLIALLAVLVIGAGEHDLARLTIINKSDMDIAIQLIGPDFEPFYYLKVPEGNHIAPTTKTFTIEKEIYSMQLFYIQTYDPVYGWECPGAIPLTLIATRNIRLNIQPCGQIPPNRGEPSMMKYWRWRWPYIY